MGRVLARCLLTAWVLAVVASALAGPPAQFEVVERFAARLSAGSFMQLRTLLPSELSMVEHGLFLESTAGPAAHARLRALGAQGARLEVSFESASADGALIVTREQLWLDDMPEGLVPLRSTVAYVVDGVRLLSITRVLDADQRDVLMREAFVGDWRQAGLVYRMHADGTYDVEEHGRPYDGGVYTIEGGVMRIVSDERTVACQPGDVGRWRLSFTNLDRHMLERIEEMCSCGRAGAAVYRSRMTE